MGMEEALRLTLEQLNRVEIRGERSIAALSGAIANIKGVLNALQTIKEEQHDGHDEQGTDLPD